MKCIKTTPSPAKLKPLNPIVYVFFLKSILRGCLHHVVGRHEWISGDGSGSAACLHGEITEDKDKPYLKSGSEAHVALRKVIMDKTFLRQLEKYTNFRY